MEENIKNFVKIYENVFTKDFCNETINQLQSKDVQWYRHSYHLSQTSQYYENEDKELWNSQSRILNSRNLQKQVGVYINEYLGTYAKEMFPIHNAHSHVRFNKYETGQIMSKHIDHIYTLFPGPIRGIPVLSIIGSLNDDYEGGEFVMWDNSIISIPTGSLLIFPSNFMFPHQVKEVTKGIRYSFVSWAW